jgi:hypothetical protein
MQDVEIIDSGVLHGRPELGMGLRTIADIQRHAKLDTGIPRSAFDVTEYELGHMVREDNGVYGYQVRDSVAYFVNSADPRPTRHGLRSEASLLRPNVKFVRIARGHYFLALQALRHIAAGEELIAVCYMH